MTELVARFLSAFFNAVHDDSLRANQFDDQTRFSPYTAAMFPRL